MIRTLVNQENTVLIVKSVSFQMVTHSLSHALPCCPDWVMQLLGVLCVCLCVCVCVYVCVCVCVCVCALCTVHMLCVHALKNMKDYYLSVARILKHLSLVECSY